MTTLCKKLFGFWKKKKSFIRFYSIEPGVAELFPIIQSAKLKRKFTNMPVVEGELSVKTCPGIRKVVSTGWVVTAPADFVIKPSSDGLRFEWLEPWLFGTSAPTLKGPSYIADHGPDQVLPLIGDDPATLKSVVKVQTPWRVETSDDVLLLQLPVTYNNEHRFSSATGFLDTRYGYNINVQLFWHVIDKEILIKAGTPLCQLIPVSRSHLSMNEYDVIVEDADESDIKKEKAFVYASNCVILKHDNLSARLDRTTKILTEYSKRRKL
jgi:hypothetical protein